MRVFLRVSQPGVDGVALSELTVRKAKAKDRDYKLSDAGGLYLLVTTNGSKLWRVNYRHLGRWKTLRSAGIPTLALL